MIFYLALFWILFQSSINSEGLLKRILFINSDSFDMSILQCKFTTGRSSRVMIF